MTHSSKWSKKMPAFSQAVTELSFSANQGGEASARVPRLGHRDSRASVWLYSHEMINKASVNNKSSQCARGATRAFDPPGKARGEPRLSAGRRGPARPAAHASASASASASAAASCFLVTWGCFRAPSSRPEAPSPARSAHAPASRKGACLPARRRSRRRRRRRSWPARRRADSSRLRRVVESRRIRRGRRSSARGADALRGARAREPPPRLPGDLSSATAKSVEVCHVDSTYLGCLMPRIFG